MNYVTTNIRLPEDDYIRLKQEAMKYRKSFAAVVREKIGIKKSANTSAAEIMLETRDLARKNAKKIRGVDIVAVLREMRYKGKW